MYLYLRVLLVSIIYSISFYLLPIYNFTFILYTYNVLYNLFTLFCLCQVGGFEGNAIDIFSAVYVNLK